MTMLAVSVVAFDVASQGAASAGSGINEPPSAAATIEAFEFVVRDLPRARTETLQLLDKPPSPADPADVRKRLIAFRQMAAIMFLDSSLFERAAMLQPGLALAAGQRDWSTQALLEAVLASARSVSVRTGPRPDLTAELGQALAHAEQARDPMAACAVRFASGWNATVRGNHEAASQAWLQALDAFGKHPICRSLSSLGSATTLQMLGDPASATRAITLLGDVAAMLSDSGYDSLLAQVAVQRGRLLLATRQPAEAAKQFGAVASQSDRSGYRWLAGQANHGLARSAMAMGDLPKARALLMQLQASSDLSPSAKVAVALSLATVNLTPPAVDAQAAIDTLLAARASYEGDALDPERKPVMDLLSRAYEAAGRPADALVALREANKIEAALKNKERAQSLAEMQARFETDRARLESQRLLAEQQAATVRRNALIAGLSFAIVAAAALGFLLRIRSRQRRQLALTSAALDQKNHDLQRLGAARSQLLAQACHDLRQPAHALSLLAEVASFTTEQTPAVRQTMNRIRDNTAILGDMMSELLQMARLEQGQYDIHLAPQSLDTILDEIEAQYRPQCLKKGLALKIQRAGAWTTTDGGLMRRVMFNLVSNAVKYTDRGEVSISVHRMDAGLRVTVADTGRGIPPDRIQDMFLPYVRLNDGSPESGLGIGLAVVKQALELLQHPLRVQSEPGKGTEVAIDLPECAPEVPGADAKAPAVDVPVHGTIVVVEDNDEIREALAAMLEQWNLTVVAASSAASADAALAARGSGEPPALLLMDHSLDGASGLDVLAAWRARAGWQDIPALLVTGDVSDMVTARARQLGVRVVFKPVRPARLKRAIADAVRPAAFADNALESTQVVESA